jgi:hypothetical protein
MSYCSKGTIIVADGNGKVVGITPGNNDEVLVYDSSAQYGVKKVSNGNGLDKKIFKLNQAKFTSTKNASYTAMYAFTYTGSEINTIDKLTLLSYMDAGITSYDVRLFDVTHSTVITSANYSNTTQAIKTISSVSNLPTTDSIFEVQARKNGGSANSLIYIDDITIIYT